MAVCSRCKSENDDYRLRCGSCGNTLSKRGDYRAQEGPQVVVLGSVEDLKRARELGELDEDDPTALGWLDSSELETAPPLAPTTDESVPRTRRVSVREIDKISGLRDLRELQAALLKAEKGDEPKPAPTESRRVQRPQPPAEPAPAPGTPTTGSAAAGAPATDSRRLERATAKSAAPPASAPDDAATEAPAGPTTGYLVNELFPEPIPLTAGRRYLMGRDARASIFLPSSNVSRRHAGIAADEKGEYWIEDLRSANGTYVNGRAVLKRRLKHGDLVDVGVFTFRFLAAKPGDPAPPVRADPDEETKTIRSVPGALSGEIEHNGVVPVLALICSAKRSGVLTLRAGPQVGRIFVIQGEVHHAQFGKALGEAALEALLPAEGGFLHFSDEKIQVKRTITRSASEIFGLA